MYPNRVLAALTGLLGMVDLICHQGVRSVKAVRTVWCNIQLFAQYSILHAIPRYFSGFSTTGFNQLATTTST